MKIISWNANGKFEKNFPAILKENADIYVIQECTNPLISDCEDYTELGSEYDWVDWVGDEKYPDYGLGMFAKKDVEIELWDLDDQGLRYFIPVTVNGEFNLLGVWTNPDIEGNKSIYYPKEITKYYEELTYGNFDKAKIYVKILSEFNALSGYTFLASSIRPFSIILSTLVSILAYSSSLSLVSHTLIILKGRFFFSPERNDV